MLHTETTMQIVPRGECELSSGIGLEGALRFLEPRKIT